MTVNAVGGENGTRIEMDTQRNNAMPKKDDRLTISPLGEFYEDVLIVDAWINRRSLAFQANSLLCAKLQERIPLINERIAYLAEKRGVSPKDLWNAIRRGEAKQIEAEGVAEENDE